ncbi:nucleoside triphosphate pyrophosphohydrolase [Halovivax limisalsi]|uniref:nucleoside triphosphate pyrophosphohydrolase n=1 Tax=Halovivax limisalsi TaxID=1453760 RepID=UPI001FFDE0D1|nr:nucleoside triphosphate pyrophosphohydrolase [Halovivax limisalsi]
MAEEFDKLVRDEVPTIIEANGETPVTHVADDEAYRRRLAEKLQEEVDEYVESRAIDELADVLEVVHAIRADRGVSADELEEIREEKAVDRGRFAERIVLERVEPGDPA